MKNCKREDDFLPCEICGRPTQFLESRFKVRLCSPVCQSVFEKDLNKIMLRRMKEKIDEGRKNRNGEC